MTISPGELKVLDAIRSRESVLRDDLALHVGFETGPGGGKDLDREREVIVQRLKRLGATIELLPGDPRPAWLSNDPPTPTLLARRPAAGPRLLLSGHLDTVHPAGGAFRGLTLAPDGKTATGPGCVDMKGGIVIALAALEALESCGERLHWSFILNSDEETGSLSSDRALRAAARDADVGFALEPAMENGGLVVERPGSGQFMIEATGKAAHVGRDFASGVSAVNELARCILKVAEIPDPARGLIASIGPLQGNAAANAVPDRARAWGNVRYPTPAAARDLESRLRSLETAPGALPGVRLFTSFNRPCKPLTDETRRLAELARDAAADLNQNLPFGTTGGVCDGNNLQDEGLATLDTLGVRGGGLHTPREWIDLSSLVERAQLLAILLMRVSRALPA
jgi:glutamate carboxypeptidase